MKIETKYDIGDHLWTMAGNKCVKVYLREPCWYGDLNDFSWKISRNKEKTSYEVDYKMEMRKESQLFRTKEELLASL